MSHGQADAAASIINRNEDGVTPAKMVIMARRNDLTHSEILDQLLAQGAEQVKTLRAVVEECNDEDQMLATIPLPPAYTISSNNSSTYASSPPVLTPTRNLKTHAPSNPFSDMAMTLPSACDVANLQIDTGSADSLEHNHERRQETVTDASNIVSQWRHA